MSEEPSLQAQEDANEENKAEAAEINEQPPKEAAELPQESEEAVDEPSPIEQLQEQLAAALKKIEDDRDMVLRSKAEMENLRRRTEKEIQESRKFALEKFARDLLVVLDSLELGIQAASGDSAEIAKLREGSELTLKQFLSVLEKYNVAAIDALGQKFNPDLHQAMAMQPDEDAEPNTVIKVFQKGYTLNDRLLRPAMVVIAQQP